MESVAHAGSMIEVQETSQDVLLKASDPSETKQDIRFKSGLIMNSALNLVLGANGDLVQSFALNQNGPQWEFEQVETDSTETDFAPIALSSKPPSGIWPYDCEKLIPCQELPYQTCGCDFLQNDGSQEKMGIVYHLGAGSEMAPQLDYGSCEELAIHGLTYRGYFKIGGVETYCENWRKPILKIL